MLFVALLRVVSGTPEERIARRAQWQYPPGTRLIAEYWLMGQDPDVVAIFEADSTAAIFAATTPWADVFDITVVPALTAEEGLKLAKQMRSPR